MEVTFYGTRGSIPVCDRNFLEFGGNTTSIEVYQPDNKRSLLLDAGSGIRTLGKKLMTRLDQQSSFFLGFSHFHWDHIQGFPFFDPAYDSNVHLSIMALGQNHEVSNIREIFSKQMQKEFFPVGLEQMGATFSFIHHTANHFHHNGTTVIGKKHIHPGGAYSYRVERNNKSIVVCTDIEYPTGIDQASIDFCKGADLLIHDAQYTDAELVIKKGWGHSSFRQAIELAEMAEVKQLIMTHHDPNHDDFFLDKKEKECQRRFANANLAREGIVYSI